MARKNRSLASFGDVADTNININNDVNEKDNINGNEDINNGDFENNIVTDNINDIDSDNDHNNDYLDSLIEGTKKKSNQPVLTGVYLQKDVLQVLDRLAKKGGKGAKSKIVNEALRKVFMEKDLL
ncbi:hypothetical protein ABET51_15760 [Metabacillus fastidiosus]|uniref:hypothetical protein n=1 Tax=Metabacillus fastidiosus TaxID=1458 RepID=UPI002E1E9B63|nr:hypothetical protein [Metabacillus fastidiosus]